MIIRTNQYDGAADFISAVDISALPEIELTNPIFYNLAGIEEDFLSILKNNGVNTIRLKLWVDPQNEHAGFQEVKTFSQRLKNLGFKVWLTLHYSDTWADPGQQLKLQTNGKELLFPVWLIA
jgi:arabinogalactan endo-1,4-beta-galactosidase